MRGLLKSFVFSVLCSAIMIPWLNNASGAETNSSVSAVLDRFVKQKYALEQDLAKKYNYQVSPNILNLFDAIQRKDWQASTNWFESVRAANFSSPGPESTFWWPASDAFGAFGLFHKMAPKFLEMYGADISKTITPGSIYFGGTDSGRFLISAFSESHNEGRPFFTLTQNQLANPTYLQYLKDMYEGRIHLVDSNDWQEGFTNYLADAQVRMDHDKNRPNEPRQVKPGEDLHIDQAGHLQSSGMVSVMAVNALLSKMIFDRNPTNEFFVEESFPLDWMLPHLTPAGLILKISQEPIPMLTEDVLKRDHQFWSDYAGRLIGNWITYDTPVKDVTDFAEKVYLRHDLSGFHGDAEFLHDDESSKAFSKLRTSIAGIYSWRLGQPPSGGIMPPQYIATGTNRAILEREADFAYKQAFALCPRSPEAIYRYVELLVNTRHIDDAILIAETAQKLDPDNTQFKYLISNLNSIKTQSGRQTEALSQVQAEVPQLESEVKANPTNFTARFDLAKKLFRLGKNDRAYEVLDGALDNPNVTVPMVMSVADAYNRINQPKKLEKALEKLTELAPDSPEAWYNLAATRATLDKGPDALQALKKTLELNTKRLVEKPEAQNIRTNLATDPRFAELRQTPEFKALVESH